MYSFFILFVCLLASEDYRLHGLRMCSKWNLSKAMFSEHAAIYYVPIIGSFKLNLTTDCGEEVSGLIFLDFVFSQSLILFPLVFEVELALGRVAGKKDNFVFAAASTSIIVFDFCLGFLVANIFYIQLFPPRIVHTLPKRKQRQKWFHM